MLELENARLITRTPLSAIAQGLKLANEKWMLVLGIETTCDETAAAVIERREDGSGRILSNIVRSQTEEHIPFGGVVPGINCIRPSYVRVGWGRFSNAWVPTSACTSARSVSSASASVVTSIRSL